MNDQQRAAMQMALEALEDSRNLVAEYLNRSETNEKAITALREALAQPKDHSEQHLNMVQGEWVDLTDDEIEDVARNCIDWGGWISKREFPEKLITKFKEKNTPKVVPQEVTEGNASEVRSTDTGEPVFLSYDDPLISETIKNDPLYIRGYEAAIEATKEKAAKVCDEIFNTNPVVENYADDCAAAIRSMK